MRLTKVHLAALAFVAGVLPAVVSADGWFSRMGETKEVTLTELLRAPREYLDVEVEFKVYFEAKGRNFNPYFTRFSDDYYGNFSAWPIDARLYDKRDYPRPYPFFFAVKSDKVWKRAKDLERLDVVKITGVVRDVFRGQPWIEVLDVSSSGGGLSESDVRRVIEGDAHFVAGKYKEAARQYGRADDSGLPGSVRADLLRRKGDAHFRAGDYDDAQDAYEDALRHAPDSEVLKQGIEASKIAHQQNRSRGRGQAVAGEMPTPAPTTAPVAANGVDEVIRLLDDPAKVATEIENWRLELEKRAAALRGGADAATAVGGADEAPEVAPQETPADSSEVGVAPESGEPPADEGQGCADEPAVEGGTEVPADEGSEQPTSEGQGCAEVPAEEGGTEQPADDGQGSTEQPADEGQPHEGCAEQPADAGQTPPADDGQAPEGCAPADEGWTDAPTDATETHEGCAPADEGWTDAPTDATETHEACGEGVPGDTEGNDEAVKVPFTEGNERVMWVSGQLVPLPRLPFFGCEEVTDDDLRAIIEEVVRNPESDVE